MAEASKTIAASIVGFRLDFCNTLLAGISVSNLTRLQRFQNILARVVAQNPRLSRFCHIILVILDLHWLPVRHRISFKVGTVTFRVLQFQSHPIFHLSSQEMHRREHSAFLRLSQYAFLHVKPPWQPPSIFISVASNVRNALPNPMSSIPTLLVFIRALKHHLFLLAYPDSSAKFGMIKPAQCTTISLRDTAPTTATAIT